MSPFFKLLAENIRGTASPDENVLFAPSDTDVQKKARLALDAQITEQEQVQRLAVSNQIINRRDAVRLLELEKARSEAAQAVLPRVNAFRDFAQVDADANVNNKKIIVAEAATVAVPENIQREFLTWLRANPGYVNGRFAAIPAPVTSVDFLAAIDVEITNSSVADLNNPAYLAIRQAIALKRPLSAEQVFDNPAAAAARETAKAAFLAHLGGEGVGFSAAGYPLVVENVFNNVVFADADAGAQAIRVAIPQEIRDAIAAKAPFNSPADAMAAVHQVFNHYEATLLIAALATDGLAYPVVEADFNATVDSLIGIPRAVKEGIKARHAIAAFRTEDELNNAVRATLDAYAVASRAIVAGRTADPIENVVDVIDDAVERGENAYVIVELLDALPAALPAAHAAATESLNAINQITVIEGADNAADAKARIPAGPVVFDDDAKNTLEVEANTAGAREVARLVGELNSSASMKLAMLHAVGNYAPGGIVGWSGHDQNRVRQRATTEINDVINANATKEQIRNVVNDRAGILRTAIGVTERLGFNAYVAAVVEAAVNAADAFLAASDIIDNQINLARNLAKQAENPAAAIAGANGAGGFEGLDAAIVDEPALTFMAVNNAQDLSKRSVIAAITATAEMEALGNRAAAQHVALVTETRLKTLHAANGIAARVIAEPAADMPDEVKVAAATAANNPNATVLSVSDAVGDAAGVYARTKVLEAADGIPQAWDAALPPPHDGTALDVSDAGNAEEVHTRIVAFVNETTNFRALTAGEPLAIAIADANARLDAVIARIIALDSSQTADTLKTFPNEQLASTYLGFLTPDTTKPADLKLIAEICGINIGVVYDIPAGYNPAAAGNENKLIIKETGGTSGECKIFEVFSGGVGAANKPVNYFNISAAAGLEQRNDDPWQLVRFDSGNDLKNNPTQFKALKKLAEYNLAAAPREDYPVTANGNLAYLQAFSSRIPALANEISNQATTAVGAPYNPPADLVLQAKYQFHLLSADADKCEAILHAATYDGAVDALAIPTTGVLGSVPNPDVALLKGNTVNTVGALDNKWNQLRQAALVKLLEQKPDYLKNKIAKTTPENIRALEGFLADTTNDDAKRKAKNVVLFDILGKDALGMNDDDFATRIAPFINSVAIQAGVDEYKNNNTSDFVIKAAEKADNSGFRAILRDIQRNPDDFQLIKNRIREYLISDCYSFPGLNVKIRKILAKRNPALQNLNKIRDNSQKWITLEFSTKGTVTVASPHITLGAIPAELGITDGVIDTEVKKQAYLVWEYKAYNAYINAESWRLVGFPVPVTPVGEPVPVPVAPAPVDANELVDAYLETLRTVPPSELLEEDIDLLAWFIFILVCDLAAGHDINATQTRKALVEQDKYRVLREIEAAKKQNLTYAYNGVLVGGAVVDAAACNIHLDALKERILSGREVFDNNNYGKPLDRALGTLGVIDPVVGIAVVDAADLQRLFYASIIANNGWMGSETLKLVQLVGFNTKFQLITDADPDHPKNGELLIGTKQKINSTRAGSVLQAITDPDTGLTSFVALDEKEVRKEIERSLARDVKLDAATYTLLEDFANTALLAVGAAIPVIADDDFNALCNAFNIPGEPDRISKSKPTTRELYNKFLNEAKVIYSQSILNKLDQVITFMDERITAGDTAAFPSHLNVLASLDISPRLQVHINAQGALGTTVVNFSGVPPVNADDIKLRAELKTKFLFLNATTELLSNVITRKENEWTSVKEQFPDEVNNLPWMSDATTGFLNALDVDSADDAAVKAAKENQRQAFRRAALVNLLERSDADEKIELLLISAKYADKRDLQEKLVNPAETTDTKKTAIANWLASTYDLGDAVTAIVPLLDTNMLLGFARVMDSVTKAADIQKQQQDRKDNLGLRIIAPVVAGTNNILETIGYTKNLKKPKSLAELDALKTSLIAELQRKLLIGDPTAGTLLANLQRSLHALYQTFPVGNHFKAIAEGEVNAYPDVDLAQKYIEALGFPEINALNLNDEVDGDFSIIAAAMGSAEQGDVENQVIKQREAGVAAGADELTIKSGVSVVTYSIPNVAAPANDVSRRFMVINGTSLQATYKNPRENAEFSDAQRAMLKGNANSDVDSAARNSARAEYLFSNPDANSPLCLEIIKNIQKLQTAQQNRAALAAGDPGIAAADNALTAALDAFKESIKKLASAQELAIVADDSTGWLSFINVAIVGAAGAAIVDGIGNGPLHADAVEQLKTVALRRYFEFNHTTILEKLWTLDNAKLADVTAFLVKNRTDRAADAAGNSIMRGLLSELNGADVPEDVMEAFIDANRSVLATTVKKIADIINIVQHRDVIHLDATNATSAKDNYRTFYLNVLATPKVFDSASIDTYTALAGAISEDPVDLTTDMIQSVQKATAKKMLGNDELLFQAIALFDIEDLRSLLPDTRNPDVYPVNYQSKVEAAFNKSVGVGAIGFNFSEHTEIQTLIGSKMDFIKNLAKTAYRTKAAAVAPDAAANDLLWKTEVILLLERLDITKLRLIEGIIYGGTNNYTDIASAIGDDFRSVLQVIPDDLDTAHLVTFIQNNLDEHLCYRLTENLKHGQLKDAKKVLDANKTTDDKFSELKAPSIGISVKKHDDAADVPPNPDLHEERLFTNGTLLKAVNRNLLTFNELKAELEELCPGYNSELAVNKTTPERPALEAFALHLQEQAKLNELPNREDWKALKNAIDNKNVTQIESALNNLDSVNPKYWSAARTAADAADKITKRTTQIKRYNYDKIENRALASALKRINNDQDALLFKHSRLDLNDATIEAINVVLRELGPLNETTGLEILAKKLYDKGVYLKRKDKVEISVGDSTVSDMAKLLEAEPFGSQIIASHNLYNERGPIQTWLKTKYEILAKRHLENQKKTTLEDDKNIRHDYYKLKQIGHLFNILRTRKVNFSDPATLEEFEKIYQYWMEAHEDATVVESKNDSDENVTITYTENKKQIIEKFNVSMQQGGFCSLYNAPPLLATDEKTIFSEEFTQKNGIVFLTENEHKMSQSDIAFELRAMKDTLANDIEPLLKNDIMPKETYDAFKNGINLHVYEKIWTSVASSEAGYGTLEGVAWSAKKLALATGVTAVGAGLTWGAWTALITGGVVSGSLTLGIAPAAAVALLGTMYGAVSFVGLAAGSVLGLSVLYNAIQGMKKAYPDGVPNLIDYLSDIREKLNDPSDNPEFVEYAENAEAMVNLYFNNIHAKLENYGKINEFLNGLREKCTKLEKQGAQKSELKVIRDEIEKYEKQVAIISLSDYQAWEIELDKTKKVIAKFRYSGRINPDTEKFEYGISKQDSSGVTEFVPGKFLRTSQQALESTFQGINSKLRHKIPISTLENVMGRFGANPEKNGPAIRVGAVEEDSSASEKITDETCGYKEYIMPNKENGYATVTRTTGTSVYRIGGANFIKFTPIDNEGKPTVPVVDTKTGIQTLGGVNFHYMNNANIEYDEAKKEYYAKGVDGNRLPFKVEIGSKRDVVFSGNSKPSGYYTPEAKKIPASGLAVDAAEFNTSLLSGTPSITALNAVNAIKEAFKASQLQEDNVSLTEMIEANIAILRNEAIDIPDQFTKALEVKKSIDAYSADRKALAVLAMEAVLQEVYRILSDPENFPGGLAESRIVLQAQDELHLKFLLSAVELVKGLFPGKFREANAKKGQEGTFKFDSVSRENGSTTKDLYDNLVKSGQVPSVVHHASQIKNSSWFGDKKSTEVREGFSLGRKDFTKTPPYFKYDDESPNTEIVKELAGHLGYNGGEGNNFELAMEKVKIIMKNAGGVDDNMKMAHEFFGKLGKQKDKPGASLGEVNELAIRSGVELTSKSLSQLGRRF